MNTDTFYNFVKDVSTTVIRMLASVMTWFILCRAAVAIFKCIEFKRLIEHEKLPPLVIRKTIPLCMAQYDKLFATTR